MTTDKLDREETAAYTVWVVALNPGYFNTENRVKVMINVSDVNDNDPIISFPDDERDTVEVSNKLVENDVITRVNATDADDAQNQRLEYEITSGNERGFVAINRRTGVIYAQQSLAGLKHEVFKLGIVVRDQGIPQRLSRADLTIVVDKNAAQGESSDGLIEQKVVMIIVGVVLSVLVMFIVIIITVCFICYRQRQKDKAHKYNCRLDANKTLINSPATNRLATNSHCANSR